MTKVAYNINYDEFCENLFKFKKSGECFDMNQIQAYLLEDDNHVLSDKQFFQYINKLIISGDVVAAYKIQDINNTKHKNHSKKIAFIEYNEFCEIVLWWKLKGEMFTVNRLTFHINEFDLFLPYYLIHDYLFKMIDDGKLIRYSKKRYQVV